MRRPYLPPRRQMPRLQAWRCESQDPMHMVRHHDHGFQPDIMVVRRDLPPAFPYPSTAQGQNDLITSHPSEDRHSCPGACGDEKRSDIVGDVGFPEWLAPRSLHGARCCRNVNRSTTTGSPGQFPPCRHSPYKPCATRPMRVEVTPSNTKPGSSHAPDAPYAIADGPYRMSYGAPEMSYRPSHM